MTQASPFYDTVGLCRQERDAHAQHNQTQETAVLAWFRAAPWASWSREQIEQEFGFPTQTASRVLANLTARGYLIKTGERVRSSLGRTCGTWKLRPTTPEQLRLLS